MEIGKSLQKIGLKKSEIAIYLYLLENSHASPAQIAKGTGVLRTNCYHLLVSLKEQRLIREEQSASGRKIYFANDPTSLLESIRQKAQIAEQVIPDIQALFLAKTNKPTIRFYDGLNEIQEIYKHSLQSQEIFAIGSTAHLAKLLPDFLAWYFKQIEKHDIIMHDIVSSSSLAQGVSIGKSALAGYAPKSIPEKYGEMPTDLLIWDNTVALISLSEPYFGTTITNPPLALSMKTLFKALDDHLKR